MATGAKAAPETPRRAKTATKPAKAAAKPAKAAEKPVKASARPAKASALPAETTAKPAKTVVKTTKAPPSPKETSAQPAAIKPNGATITDQQFRNFVEVAAYYIAERRGFQGGNTLEDWEQAEREVTRMLQEHVITL